MKLYRVNDILIEDITASLSIISTQILGPIVRVIKKITLMMKCRTKRNLETVQRTPFAIGYRTSFSYSCVIILDILT